ncbi:hypothetical protein [Cupriavidus basilensis]|uniref:hypothetical protein n=1 Tax=Cupriavidus basilensis TaxID=68895 RepID=UPI003F5BD76F
MGNAGAAEGAQAPRSMVSERAFLGVSALLFFACTAGTIAWSASMSAMGAMPMPGGWTMSMAWMRMCGQTWPGVAASFLGMWVVMMTAMMLPSPKKPGKPQAFMNWPHECPRRYRTGGTGGRLRQLRTVAKRIDDKRHRA